MENRFLTSDKAKGTAYESEYYQRKLVLRRFYHSDTYKRLADETTKLWHYGPVALYQEFTDELKQKGNEYGKK